MPIVADASSLLCLAFNDEAVPYGQAVIEVIRDEGGLAPTILWYELRNALIANERRGRITAERAMAFLALLKEVPLVLQPPGSEAAVMELARRLRLSLYDASYLELAVREGLPLATLDDALAMAARKVKTRHWKPARRKA